MFKLSEKVDELTQAYLAGSGQARDHGRTEALVVDQDFCAEFADVLATAYSRDRKSFATAARHACSPTMGGKASPGTKYSSPEE